MITGSRFLINGSPSLCAFCREPFPLVGDRVEAWRGTDGRYYCGEFCASDGDEAHAGKFKKAS